ncbi:MULTISPECIES: hypothetical protein [Bacillus amyloliquefaciens group]|nr:hypothetical protein [Bacillus amyloliquefaciens]AEB24967.1 hypothetical protein BAMTA208_14030 [Bacillus amyloliquefaciens TA208]AEK89996.1 hypothetical protein BAXH7_02872 [Bacillus amyloliquefaciens XH7]MEC1833398.1 hypothetical protein [Bacillus amyloliquefaciens]MEC1836564.1 hypothetical protein [Bacillus amyloliquefaciens]MEC1845124.1 hypothetical protein [Bacillus amyloliquefaciens]
MLETMHFEEGGSSYSAPAAEAFYFSRFFATSLCPNAGWVGRAKARAAF